MFWACPGAFDHKLFIPPFDVCRIDSGTGQIYICGTLNCTARGIIVIRKASAFTAPSAQQLMLRLSLNVWLNATFTRHCVDTLTFWSSDTWFQKRFINPIKLFSRLWALQQFPQLWLLATQLVSVWRLAPASQRPGAFVAASPTLNPTA